MSLHPDVAAFLELIDFGRETGRSLPMHSLEVSQARREFDLSAATLDADPPQEVQASACQIPLRDGGLLTARLYKAPGAAEDACPVILYFHGGGYVVGSLDSHDGVCRRIAAATGQAVLAPAYRLAPEHPYPAAIHDAVDAATWLVKQANDLGLDPARLVVAGDSAGATLATVLALMADGRAPRVPFRPCAQLLFYPVTDASCERASYREFAEGYMLESRTMGWFYQHYLRSPGDRQHWHVSPLLAEVGEYLAPAYISVAEYDPLRDEGVAYAEHLRGVGAAVTLRCEQGLTHDYLRMTGICGASTDAYRAMADWLRNEV